VGDVAVVLLARRQGEVVVGVELKMDAESTDCSACVLAAALQ